MDIINVGIMGLFLVAMCLIPFILTWLNIRFLISNKYSRFKKYEDLIELLTIGLGLVLTLFYIELSGILLGKDWFEILINQQKHTPIAIESQPTIFTLSLIAVIGYLFLRLGMANKLSPLIAVTSITCVYLGIVLSVIWIVQTFDFFLVLLPINCIILGLKAIKDAIYRWQKEQENHWQDLVKENKIIRGKLSKLLEDSSNWLYLGFLFMLPMLGIILIILVLFGQQPDAIIKAWTNTSDWSLSEKISPPNVSVDEHYLCTVAASGHRKVVKPQRMGIRHNHQVVVNRQLCVANAFEQILEEKLPRSHGQIRKFYDDYGYPIARKIKSPFTADVIYFLMKPLEYLFLIIIYLVDKKPENRIAMQYITKIPD